MPVSVSERVGILYTLDSVLLVSARRRSLAYYAQDVCNCRSDGRVRASEKMGPRDDYNILVLRVSMGSEKSRPKRKGAWGRYSLGLAAGGAFSIVKAAAGRGWGRAKNEDDN
jgi:hypothetical protein